MNWHHSILLETVSRVTPLGIRFRDVVTGAIVAGGLDVRVRPTDAPERWSTASPTRRGIFTARNLPGLHGFELGAGDHAFWDEITADKRRTFILEAWDRQGRFLPTTLALDLPQKGFALPSCLSPDDHDQAVPLYSAPSRPPVPGMAVVRIELAYKERDAPASWTRVEMTLGDDVVSTIADERGLATMMAPYPRIANGASGALVDATWNVQVRAFSSGDLPQKDVPDVCAVLAQPERALVRERNSNQPFVPPGRLRFGHELVLRDHPSGKVFVRLSA